MQTIVSLLLLVVAVPVVLLAILGMQRMLVGALIVVIVLTFILNQFSATVRRFHDVGQPGWWCLGNFVPGANLAMFFFLVATPGQPGPNRYGFNPIETGHDILRRGQVYEADSDWQQAFECYRYVFSNKKFGAVTQNLALEYMQDLHRLMDETV